MSEATNVRASFETSDGRDFDSRKEATKHQKVVDAQAAFEKAQYALSEALGQAQFTADGVPFTFGVFNEYWHIQQDFGGLPILERVTLYACVMLITEHDDTVSVRVTIGDRDRTFSIAHLYARERAAKVALLAAWEARLAEYAAQVERLRAEVNRGR